jgi:hypothetical protein
MYSLSVFLLKLINQLKNIILRTKITFLEYHIILITFFYYQNIDINKKQPLRTSDITKVNLTRIYFLI